jgi:D-beta-D-heptose 7-phosphate kinase/D-beta-D-heptose 1-phosphate adenosyltransferase
MVLTEGDGHYKIFECTPVEVYDVTGAGDTVIAYIGACLANGLDCIDAVYHANIAAGIQVSKSGTTPIHVNEVDEWISKNDKDRAGEHKIKERQAAQYIQKHNPDKKVIFTNGCFDILHLGHVRYLRQAASLGDILVVGLNSDDSVRRLKGDTRPINDQSERAHLLAALEFVDYIVIFDEDTPYNLINEIQPDVLVKGGDYTPDEVIGRDIVESNGGKLVLIPLVEGKSTTAVVEKIMS